MCHCTPNKRTPVCDSCPEEHKKAWEFGDYAPELDMGELRTILPNDTMQKVADKILQSFFKKFSDEMTTRFYDEMHNYLYEHHMNFQEAIMDEAFDVICGKEWGRFFRRYDGKLLRSKIFEEHKDEIIQQIPKDLLEENAKLKEELQREKEAYRRLQDSRY